MVQDRRRPNATTNEGDEEHLPRPESQPVYLRGAVLDDPDATGFPFGGSSSSLSLSSLSSDSSLPLPLLLSLSGFATTLAFLAAGPSSVHMLSERLDDTATGYSPDDSLEELDEGLGASSSSEDDDDESESSTSWSACSLSHCRIAPVAATSPPITLCAVAS